jgi:hypothetical protein
MKGLGAGHACRVTRAAIAAPVSVTGLSGMTYSVITKALGRYSD